LEIKGLRQMTCLTRDTTQARISTIIANAAIIEAPVLSAPDPTVSHPACQALLAWAKEQDALEATHWFLHLLRVRTKRHWDFIGTALDGLAACEPHFQRWQRRGGGTEILELSRLASAWSEARPTKFRYTRAISHPPTTEFSEKGAVQADYLYLLLQCQTPIGGDAEPLIGMRAWLLQKGLQFARRGRVMDELLWQGCTSLRVAAYEKKRDWAEFFAPLAGYTSSSFLLEGRLGAVDFEETVAARLGVEKLSKKHEQTLTALRDLVQGRQSRDDWADAVDTAAEWPVPEIIEVGTSARPAAPEIDLDTDDELEVPTFLSSAAVDSDDAEAGIVVLAQDPTASPAEQDEDTRTIHLLHGADARFLVWDWNRPSAAERCGLDALIERAIAAPNGPHDQLLASLAALALQTGLSLPEVLRVPLGSEGRPGSVWRLDITARRLVQQAPRRDGHWKPAPNEHPPIRSALPELQWRLPHAIADCLARARAEAPSAAQLGDFWPPHAGSCPAAFNRWVQSNPVTARLTYGSLAMGHGVQVFLSSGDPVLARLASARSFAGLPASAAYAAYTAATVAQHNQFALDTADFDANAAGSLLDADDGHLRAAFDRLHSQMEQVKRTGDFVDWHNLLALYWDARLRAATGVRPIGKVWTTVGDFDWQKGFCFIDDKASPHGSTGRLVPIPPDLLYEFRATYVEDHLSMLRASLGSRLADLDRAALLFVLEEKNGSLCATAITHAHRERLGLEQPLPSNLMRHRLRTWLHRHDADPEVIDSVLGHHDGATLTHGAYGMRVWLDDAQAIRPLLSKAVAELAISSPPRWREPPPPEGDGTVANLPLPYPSTFQPAETTPAVQRQWRREAFSIISQHLREKLGSAYRPVTGAHSLLNQLGLLNERHMDELAQKLCRSDKGLPAIAGTTRFEVLQRLAACSWRYKRQPLNLVHRYLLEEQEPSPFTALAPQAGVLRERLTNALEAAFRAEPHLSKVSAKSATLLALADVVLTTGATHPRLLQAMLASSDELRLVTLEATPYLEWSPQTSLVDRPEAAVQRFRLSRRAAVLLARLFYGTKRAVQHDDPTLPLRVSFTTILGLPPSTGFGRWLEALCMVVRQDNAITLPGTVAAFLDGRVMTASLDQSDWVRVRTGRKVAAPWHRLGAPDTISLYEGSLVEGARHNVDLGSAALEELLRKTADEFLSMVRRRAQAIDGLGTQGRRDLKVDELESAIDNFSRKAAMPPSGAIRMLGLWLVHLLRGKRANKYAKILADTAVRYLDALAPGFRELAYDLDPAEMDGDELGEFYRMLLQTSTAKDKRYQYERLRHFHSFVREAFAVDECDWSSVTPTQSPLLGAPGLIDDELYLDALSLCETATPPAGIATWQCTAFLVFARRFGLRGKEVLGLNRSDLQGWPHDPVVSVRRRRDSRIKSPAAKRIIPLVFPLEPNERAAIDQLLARLASSSVGLDDPPLFADLKSPGKRLDIRLVRPHLNRLLRAAAGRMGLTVHDLRHSFGNCLWAAVEGFQHLPAWFVQRLPIDLEKVRTTLLGRTVDRPSRRGAVLISRQLGHASVSVSTRSYIHLIPEVAEHLGGFDGVWEPRWALQPLDGVTALDDLPDVQPLPANAPQIYEALTPGLALEALKLLTLQSARTAEATLNLREGTLEPLATITAWLEARRQVAAPEGDVTTTTGGTAPVQQARAARLGLLATIRRSAYSRLRTGLLDAGPRLIDAAKDLSSVDIQEGLAMMGPAGEISLWTPAQARLVSAMLEVAVKAPARIGLRAPPPYQDWAEKIAAALPWPLPVLPTSQIPAVHFEISGGTQRRRLAVLVNDGAAGFTYNRAELIVAFVCVISCANLSLASLAQTIDGMRS
jgi:integrase